MKTNSQGRANTKGLSNFLSTFPTFTSTSRQTNEQTRSQIPDSNPGPDLRNYVPNNEQVLIPMLVPDPTNGLGALSRMKSLTLREPTFEEQALMEIGEKGDSGYEYYAVFGEQNQNSILIYSRLDRIEALKLVRTGKNILKIYQCNGQYIGQAKIESKKLCTGGQAEEVTILNKYGTLACKLVSASNFGEFKIKGPNGNKLGKLKLIDEGYIEWKENEETMDVEMKALLLGSAFLVKGSYRNYKKYLLIVLALIILPLIYKIVKLLFK